MKTYSPLEEKINIYSHIFGAFLGLIGLILLIIKSLGNYSLKSSVSFVVFGLSMIIMFVASASYHSAEDIKLRYKRKVLDHAAIYVMIAGTYTPFALGAIGGSLGWTIFAISWSFALVGIILKIFFTGKFSLISTLMYVFMGWMIMFFIKPLNEVIPNEGFYWLLVGGILYTIGAVAYSVKKIKLNHAIFHVFVVAGSVCHFLSVYLYI